MAYLVGISFDQWMKLLWENKFRVDPKYIPRALLLTIKSLRNSSLRKKEEKLYREEIEKTEVKDPVFILGHWRSGTTLIHELMALDERFAFPNLFQVSHPHSFLTKEKVVEMVLSRIPPEKRPMDNMKVTFRSPGEDESAVAALSSRSPVTAFGFPYRRKYYNMCHTFTQLKEEDLKKWKASFLWFLKKLAWRYKLPLVLKSPIHTARVKILLDIFPKAKFIHISRNPFIVYQSTLNLYKKMIPEMAMQKTDINEWVDDIIENYRVMYDAYFSEKCLIPEGHLVEVRFESFEKDVIGHMRYIYESLGLGDFKLVETKMENYMQGQKEYKKNNHEKISVEAAEKILANWGQCFDNWGYSRDYSDFERIHAEPEKSSTGLENRRDR